MKNSHNPPPPYLGNDAPVELPELLPVLEDALEKVVVLLLASFLRLHALLPFHLLCDASFTKSLRNAELENKELPFIITI